VIDRFAELEIELTSGEEERLADLRQIFEGEGGLSPATSSKLEAALEASSHSNGNSGTNAAVAEPAPTVADNAGDEAGADPLSQSAEVAEPAVAEAPASAPKPSSTPSKSEERRREASDRRRSSRSGSGATGRSAHGPDVEKPTAAPARRAAVEPQVVAPEPLVVGKTAGVLADDTIAEAGRKVLRFHLARMLAKEAGTRTGADAEDLHSMRVATRRMRAAWRVFGDGFRPGRTRRYRTRLREVAGRLGAVRDLDVLIEAGEHYMGSQSRTEQLALQPLFAAWRAQREDARRLLLVELDSDGYARWADDFRDFVRTDGAAAKPVGPTEPHRIRDTAASRIWLAYEQVRAYEAVLRWADVATLHDLRIAAKWLRYTMEFVRECLGPEAPGLIARVVALQDHLGMLHDADVAASMARAFLVERSGRLSETESAAIGRYLVDRERDLARLRRTVGRPWRQVAGLAFRRSLGRTLAAA
jgi:CHAD domain-containing protein